jgi:hypothetical protein
MPMLRHRRFLQVMHRFALMGALLMAVAPVVSRWVQSHRDAMPVAMQAMCGGADMPMAGMDHAGMDRMAHDGHHAMPMAADMAMTMDHGGGMPMPAGHDGAACDYCVLAGGLLPFVLALLVLPLLRIAVHPLPPGWALPRADAAWPAHAARGPPLHA